MLIEIIRHTPYWVWLALGLLLWRGYTMSQPHQVPLARITLLPGLFLLLSLGGVISSFGARPEALACWAAGLALSAYEMQRRGPIPGARYQLQSRSFALPGSWMPLALFMLIFCVKYGVGIELALHDGLRRTGWFVLGVSACYGAISGLFLGRALRLRLVLRRAKGLAAHYA